jgi:3-hydroxybutyryl-CoA dehydratase
VLKKSYKLVDIEIGMTASDTRTITESEIIGFAKISGDSNPVHLDAEYAKQSRFKRRIAHGLLSASYFSALFGTKLPGPGCVYTSQNLNFLKPVYIDDIVTATVSVVSIDIKRRCVTFNTVCTVKEKKVIDGRAELYLPKQ